MSPSTSALLAPPDIEFPLRVRGGDRRTGDGGGSSGGPRAVASPAAPRLPFLIDRLLSAPSPFGLDVELKSEERLVGTWTIEISLRDDAVASPSRASANLYVCASARNDARATGAFLVVRRWSVGDLEKPRLERFYEMLSVAAIERLDSLLGSVPNASGEARSCVLYLVDGRRFDKKGFSADRLQIRLLEDLEGPYPIVGIDLRIAHGKGTGTQPHAVFASTLPAPLQPGDSGFDAAEARAPQAPSTQRLLIGEVFVRETLSPENMRWKRRASDRAALAPQPLPRATRDRPSGPAGQRR